MRLHNRQVKAGFWTDSELLRNFTRDERMFYQGLWQLADDSGCLEYDPWAFKIHLYPLDSDITPEIIEQCIEKFTKHNKLIHYEIDDKKCLFIKNFHKHQNLNKPTPPNKESVPLPPFIEWIKGDSRNKSQYIVGDVSETCPGHVGDVSGTCPGHVPLELRTKNYELRTKLEVSGGITLKNIRKFAAAGVEMVSLGDLTHSIDAVDLSMEITG